MAYTWQDYKGMTETGQLIGRKVEMVKADEAQIGVLSTGERIAVALVLDKPALFPKGDYTILQAVAGEFAKDGIETHGGKGGFDDHARQVGQNVFTGLPIAAPVGMHGRQLQFFTEQMAA